MIIFIILILLIVTGCSNKDVKKHHYIFKGENDNWTIVYEVNANETFFKKDGTLHYKNKSNATFTATCKKDSSDLASKKNIEISYKNSVGGGKLNEEIDQANPQKTFSMQTSSTGGALVNEDELIEVNINIDGDVQTIELKNE